MLIQLIRFRNSSHLAPYVGTCAPPSSFKLCPAFCLFCSTVNQPKDQSKDLKQEKQFRIGMNNIVWKSLEVSSYNLLVCGGFSSQSVHAAFTTATAYALADVYMLAFRNLQYSRVIMDWHESLQYWVLSPLHNARITKELSHEVFRSVTHTRPHTRMHSTCLLICFVFCILLLVWFVVFVLVFSEFFSLNYLLNRVGGLNA